MAHSTPTPIREVVGTPEPGPLYRLEYCDVRFWYPWHFHPEVEIKHVVRGTGTRVIGDSVEPFTDGDLCIVGSGIPHCWSSEPERGRWVRAQVVQFDSELLRARGQANSGFDALAAVLDRARRGLEVTGPERLEASVELGRVLAARTDARQLAHLVTFLAIVADSPNNRVLAGATTTPAREGSRQHLAEQVLRYLRERIELPVTEASAAREFGLSPSGFSRFFQREFGKSFSRYVVELRVARASNLLLHEVLSVREIARLAGFGTVASLNRHFRAVKGTTPTSYRRRGRELNRGFRTDARELLRCDGAGRRPERPL